MKVQPGVYEHFKGNLYRVLGTAKHSETGDFLVVYQPAYSFTDEMWARPVEMFTGTVIDEDGEEIPRFRFVKEPF